MKKGISQQIPMKSRGSLGNSSNTYTQTGKSGRNG
jgi:hypothetical protein